MDFYPREWRYAVSQYLANSIKASFKIRNFGKLTVSDVILKSSNIGTTKIALNLTPEELWSTYNSIGIGQSTESGFPGEVVGHIKNFQDWYKVEHATLAFGYGMSITALQLARAYNVLASGGKAIPISMLKVSDIDSVKNNSSRVLSNRTTDQIISMLRSVVSERGTGNKASIPGYSVAGKTGTVHKSAKGGYEEDKYISLFAGTTTLSSLA